MKFTKRTQRSLLILSTLSCLATMSTLTHPAMAATANKTNQWYFGIGGGLLQTNSDKGSVVAMSLDPKDLYAITMMPDKAKNNYVVNLSAGMQFNWQRNLLPGMRAGLMYSYQGVSQHTGTIYDAMQQPHLFIGNYKYQVQSQVVLFDQAFEIVHWNNITPYIHTGVGVAQNSATNYEFTGSGDIQTNFQFANQTSTGLAYVVGLGVEYKLTGNWNLNLAYDYLNQGSVQLGKSSNTTVNSPAKNTISNQMITLGVRYAFAK
jgi:opacity protein-like surface antigen